MPFDMPYQSYATSTTPSILLGEGRPTVGRPEQMRTASHDREGGGTFYGYTDSFNGPR